MGLRIGLTGGIGSGKSTVASYFAKLKVPIIDADTVVHDLLKPTTIIYKKIVARLGNSYLNRKNILNKKKLRNLIFTNKQERLWLEKLLHPKVRTTMQKQAEQDSAPYSILVIPLLFETKFPLKLDKILVIDCSKKSQINRTRKRDHSNLKEIQTIIKTQINRRGRRQKADNIIDNSGSLASLKKTVKKLHHYYLSLS